MDFPALNVVPKISKNFVAFLCGMAIVAPFWKGPADKRVPGMAESHANTDDPYGGLGNRNARHHTLFRTSWQGIVATKISILSNDQTCHLCNVGSIVYSIFYTPEATNLKLGCGAMLSNLVKISSQKTFETLKISL